MTISCVPLLAILGCCAPASGQWSIGGGLGYGAALFVNSPFFARRPSMDACAELSYMPGEGRLFPSFSYMLKTITVPVRNAVFKDQDDFANTHNFALRLNYRDKLEPSYHLLYLGIGVADIRPGRNLNDPDGNAITMTDTGSIHLYPMVQAGVKFMRRVLPNSGFYLGIEAQLQYVAMHSQNRYYLLQGPTLTTATIDGDILMPGLAVKLLYVFDGVERQ